MRRRVVLLFLAGLGCLLTASTMGASAMKVSDQAPVRAPRSFAFAAAGDLGANDNTAAALRRLDRSDARFFLALGDLDYDETPTDRAWCRYVKEHLPSKGKRFPFEVLVGNHEQDGGPDGRIAHHARCLPDRLDATHGPGSRYGVEYAFTYPRRNPFAKVIMLAPNMTVAGRTYSYAQGTRHRRWLVDQIDRARAHGIGWVIVGMHYPCPTTGERHHCDSGPEVLNLLVRKRVDLVLAGHNHIYERSKQLAHTPDGCRWIAQHGFDRDCVVRGWRDGVYRKGAGTVLVTAGTVGGRHQGLNPRDPERRYFAETDGNARGFVRYVVRRDRLRARFVGVLARDSFSIVRR